MSEKNSIKATYIDKTVYCKVEGMGNMQNSYSLRNFTEHMFEEGLGRFVIDLSLCTGMDSTFMGTLLGIALLKGIEDHSPKVVLVNCSSVHLKLLDGLGVTQLIPVSKEDISFPPFELIEVSEEGLEEANFLETIYHAHKNLVQVEPENYKKFGNFLKSLLKDIS